MLPILRGAGKIDGGTQTETLFCHEHGLNSTERAASNGAALRVHFGQALQIGQRSHLVFEMQFHQFDKLPAAGLRASRLVCAIEKIHDVFAGGAAVAGALQYARQYGRPGQKVLVFLADAGHKYMSKIFNDDWMRENGFLEEEKGLGTVRDLLSGKPATSVLAVGRRPVSSGWSPSCCAAPCPASRSVRQQLPYRCTVLRLERGSGWIATRFTLWPIPSRSLCGR